MSTTTSKPIVSCQICDNKKMESILFLGYFPPVNTMPTVGSVLKEQAAYPLELFRCPDCTLVQIGCEVDADVLFPPEYPYLSGSTKILRENFADLYKKTLARFQLKPSDLIVDIGSNDGTLLSNFKEGGHKVLGIEPSQAGELANKKGIQTWIRFFNEEAAKKVVTELGAARLVTAANVFAHIGNVHAVVKGIVTMLAPKGVFVSESHYALGLLETVQYDTIYHEHLRHYSLKSLSVLLEKNGLEIFHVELIPTHGGSIRVYSARKGDYPVENSVRELMKKEDDAGLTSGELFKKFKSRVVASKLKLMDLLNEIKSKGQKVYGIGAPSRASTLICYTGLDESIIDAVMEIKTSHKVNKYMPGTKIPVLDEALLFEKQPDYALLLSWHISNELIANLRNKGYKGKFIVPLPEPTIVT